MKKAIEDGGPAFPVGSDLGPASNIVDGGYGGMSLRDWFAGQVSAGIMANTNWTTVRTTQQACLNPDHHPGQQLAACVAVESYMVADAMIAARKNGGAQ